MIPVIDLFAGPGGLCEGFSQPVCGQHPFRPVLSIEMDPVAHKTLTLRAFVHYFMRNSLRLPSAYYAYVNGRITREELFERYPEVSKEAHDVAWCAELGGSKIPKAEFDRRISEALGGNRDWLLIGGPPCQAYSLVGRSRSVGGIKNDKKISWEAAAAEFNKDKRQRLYRQYLRIIAAHSPAVFVMENVAGMLSAKVDGSPVFPRILEDLQNPGHVATRYFPDMKKVKCHEYHVFSFVTGLEESAENGERFLIRAEKYGVPQCRHRVILLGVRDDYFKKRPQIGKLVERDSQCSVRAAIGDLPKMKSAISRKGADLSVRWEDFVCSICKDPVFEEFDDGVKVAILDSFHLRKRFLVEDCGNDWQHNSGPLSLWYDDKNLTLPLNHVARSHMAKDLWRYLFVSAYGSAHGRSPTIADFPADLLPDHANVHLDGDEDKVYDFADRFKVQLWARPSSTVTSHIAKDGHYFIHPDSSQCRSLTVREAARLQTFPDNYFFEGNRTQQYHQVGNAVPPYLANQLAEIVFDVFKQVKGDLR